MHLEREHPLLCGAAVDVGHLVRGRVRLRVRVRARVRVRVGVGVRFRVREDLPYARAQVCPC